MGAPGGARMLSDSPGLSAEMAPAVNGWRGADGLADFLCLSVVNGTAVLLTAGETVRSTRRPLRS